MLLVSQGQMDYAWEPSLGKCGTLAKKYWHFFFFFAVFEGLRVLKFRDSGLENLRHAGVNL
jgi:hypothetical protein